MLNKILESKLLQYTRKYINIKFISRFNKLIVLQRMFKMPGFSQLTRMYLKRRFTVFVETKCFLQLDYAEVFELLSSSGLQITSEIEVFAAADRWISHNPGKRNKHAENLLLQVRFPLLSDYAVELILRKTSSFQQVEECRAKINEILKHEINFLEESKKYFTNRYCPDSSFSVFNHGNNRPALYTIGKVNKVDQNSLKCVRKNGFKRRFAENAVCFREEVFVFSGNFDDGSVKKYSPVSNTCEVVANLDDESFEHAYYCICVLMDKIYLMGGESMNEGLSDICLEFDPKTYQWKERARMMEFRANPACAIFAGRIVVSGGLVYNNGEVNDNYWNVPGYHLATRSVEEYDHVRNSWSEFARMINPRCCHQSVSVGNKLFVNGGGTDTCEVYDF